MRTIYIKTLITFFSLLVLISCKEDEIEFEDMDDMAITLSGDRSTEKVDIQLSGTSDKWHIYSPTEDFWLTFEPVQGESSIMISAKDNDINEQRTSYIMIKSGNTTQKINITQDELRQIVLSDEQIRMRYIEYSTDVTIIDRAGFKDLTFKIEEADKNWLSATLKGDVLTVSTKENPLDAPRESIILISATETLSGATRTKELKVIQGKGGLTPYVFDLPDFSESKVYKVMDGDKQVAQIAKEYLFTKDIINSQAIVVYPISNDGSVELHKGYVAQVLLENKDLTDETYSFKEPTDPIHGGSLSFSIETQKIKFYSQGELQNPVTKIYMPGDIEMGPDEIAGSKQATTKPHLIEDIRNEETNYYPIVKIGTQYWMGEHLNTIYYNQNKEYSSIPTNASSVEERTAASYSVYGFADGEAVEAEQIRDRYGLLYSYLTIGGFETLSEANVSGGDNLIDNLSPEGWVVPSIDDLYVLRDNINDDFLRLRKFIDYDTGEQIFHGDSADPNRKSDENITGFDSLNSSYRNTGGSFVSNNNPNSSWMWSRTFQRNEESSAFHTTSLQTYQAIRRQFSIRSINNTSIKIVD